MKFKAVIFSALSALALASGVLFASPGSTQQPTERIQTFPVGNLPVGLAFDGENMWVANFNDNTITKLRASDGMSLGTFPVGQSPTGLLFDGTNVWVANLNDDTLMKIRPSDGAILGTFPAPSPYYLAFDGEHIWSPSISLFSAGITKLRASDGVVVDTIPVDGTAYGIAFDGANMWVAIDSNKEVI